MSIVTQGSTAGAVKAPSTAAVAADPAAVVTISPNSATVTDGTNAAAVKAASTAAAAADKALVVSVSPNTPVKIFDGTNTAAVLAGADGLAVGNGLVADSEEYLYNGTTWDRRRGNWNTSTGDTGTKTVTFNGATQTNFDSWAAMITIRLGTVSGTSPTLSAQFQYSPDAGTTWISMGAALANLTASSTNGLIVVAPQALTLTSGAAAAVMVQSPMPRTWRLVYTIGGTTPSFAITAVNVNYSIG